MENLLVTILSSIGGTTLILGGLFGWLGKRQLALLQSDISKELEQHKSKLKFNEKFQDNQLEASSKLYKIMKNIVPDKSCPEMSWDEACHEIADNFEIIEKQLAEFLGDHYTTLPPDIYEIIQETEYLCSNGKLELRSPEMPDALNQRADTVFQNIKNSCIKLKSYIDGHRQIKEIEPFAKR
jgi:DNA-directed RNA polymerase delta subunit